MQVCGLSFELSPYVSLLSRESEITLEKVRKILGSGANVILTTKGIDDLCLKEFIEAGAMAVRRCRKEDLRRIAKATGATLISSLANLDGEETFEKEYLGYADEVVQERISDDELILVKGTKVVNSSSIILRGANDYLLDEMERALHDSLCVIKRTLESGSVVPGGGAVEAALSIYLENFATTLGSREQLAIAEFASALLTIPKTLAVNAAKDSTDLVAKLRAYHNAAQTASLGDPKKVLMHYGLDLMKGEVRDNVKAGVLEPTISKVRSLKSALEAATSLLRIDDGASSPFIWVLEHDPRLTYSSSLQLLRSLQSSLGMMDTATRKIVFFFASVPTSSPSVALSPYLRMKNPFPLLSIANDLDSPPRGLNPPGC